MKTQITKIIQSGGFFGRFLEPLLKVELPLMKSVLKLLVKSVLIPLGLTEAASVPDAGTYTNYYGLGERH